MKFSWNHFLSKKNWLIYGILILLARQSFSISHFCLKYSEDDCLARNNKNTQYSTESRSQVLFFCQHDSHFQSAIPNQITMSQLTENDCLASNITYFLITFCKKFQDFFVFSTDLKFSWHHSLSNLWCFILKKR